MQNILIIKLKHLGDTLTTTPVIGGIRRAWPEARISYLVNPGSEDLVRFHPDVSEVLTVPRSRGMARQLRLIKDLRRRKFDLVLELSGGDRGAFLAFASGASLRVGYRPKSGFPLDRRLAFHRRVTTAVESRHTVEYHLDALRTAGVEPGHQPLSLHWPEEAAEDAGEILAAAGIEPGRKYAVVHPGSRWMFKAWRPEGNARVIDYLAGEKGLAVVVTGAPEERERAFVDKVLQSCTTNPVDLAGRLDLPRLAAVIAGAALFFGVDSLPMHMAAAVGAPAVVLFGPSGEHMWGPWGPGHEVVTLKNCDCRPCGRDGCDGSKVSRCLTEIKASDVFPALDRALERSFE